ncbi:MAG: hypothetical protein ACRD6N_09385 [Pyrinomonadaceae bacterium]
MEREKELVKLINVLRRTSRMALQSEWTGGKEDVAAFCTEQYNRVLARLKEIDAGVGSVFDPLPAGSSLTVVAMASRQLAAYYEDELGPGKGFGRGYGFSFDPKMFKEFWEHSSREIEDLGEFIRESIEEWARQRKKTAGAEERKAGSKQ